MSSFAVDTRRALLWLGRCVESGPSGRSDGIRLRLGLVVASSGIFDFREVFARPIGEVDQELRYGPSELSERVLDADWDFGEHHAFDEAVALKSTERVREHLLRRALEVVVKTAVAVHAACEEIQEIDLPFRRK